MYENEPYEQGINVVTREEELLCEAYLRKGRKDLASCVAQARPYQRLRDLMKDDGWLLMPEERLLGMLNGLTDALAPKGPKPLPTSVQQWQEVAMQCHSSDPYLASVVDLEAQMKIIRQSPAKPGSATSPEA